ncbi:MAG: tRNA dimethylallyltransferase [Firmicutes bacterium ADurb.Bin193]|nr:MAG: tRNA dimethylallyltransferase [Firmicutes bacterium ADurb.Bin193]
MMKPLIVITGPTASGKTAYSVEMAQKIGGEIINADSMQIYKHMDIGTAKPSMEERGGIPHHLMDIVEPWENYSVAQYCKEAHRCIAQIHDSGKIPILVGGTGLYIDSVVYNIEYGEGGADEEFRREMKQLASERGNEYILNMLEKVDPQSAAKIHLSDTKRIIRALEVYHLTGETITEQNKKSRLKKSPYDAKIYAIEMERQELYRRINARVDMMFEAGLTDEVKRLLGMGVSEKATSMQAIGYKETAEYLRGEASFSDAVEKIKRNTRRYAKRQLVWFRRNSGINWVRR